MSVPASVRGGAVAGVILAAGASSRLGTPKQLLRYRGETLLHRAARLALAAGLEPVHVVLGCNAPAVGAALEELRGRVTAVVNEDWQAGMGSSLARGIASLPAPARPGSDAAAGTEPGFHGTTGSDTAAASVRESGVGTETCGAAEFDGKPRATGPAPRGVTATGSAPGAALVLVTDQPHLSHVLLVEIAAAFRTGGAALVASRYASGALGVPALFARRYFPKLRSLAGDRGARALFERYRDHLVTVAFPDGDLDIDTPAAASTLEFE